MEYPKENRVTITNKWDESDIDEICRLAEEQAEANRQFYKWMKKRSNEMLEEIKRNYDNSKRTI